MQFSTTTLTLFLTALASLSTTQARIGQTHSADNRMLMEEETAGLDGSVCPKFQPDYGDECNDLEPDWVCYYPGTSQGDVITCACRHAFPSGQEFHNCYPSSPPTNRMLQEEVSGNDDKASEEKKRVERAAARKAAEDAGHH